MATLNIIDGKMRRNGEFYRPGIGDMKAKDCLSNAEHAQKIPLVQGKYQKSGIWRMSLSFTCPYCGIRRRTEASGKVMMDTRREAMTALLPCTCSCGAAYAKHDTGLNAKQTNQ